jgi:hypothetical protein
MNNRKVTTARARGGGGGGRGAHCNVPLWQNGPRLDLESTADGSEQLLLQRCGARDAAEHVARDARDVRCRQLHDAEAQKRTLHDDRLVRIM